MTLHLSKVAVGCGSLSDLAERQRGRAATWEGQEVVPCRTRFRPKRAEPLIGGSLYWIIRHCFAARQEILGFAEDQDGEGKPCCRILLSSRLVPVAPVRKRAHQGWRYLEPDRVPRDLAGDDPDAAEALPAELVRELSVLGLL
jgi:hypothetical protein